MPRRLANKEKDVREQSPAGIHTPLEDYATHPKVTAIKHKRMDDFYYEVGNHPYPTAFSGYRKII